MSGNVVGTLALAVIAKVKDGRASKLRLRVGGAAPDSGDSHLEFPSGSFARSCRGNAFEVCGKVSDDECEEVRAQFVAKRIRLEDGFRLSGVSRWVPGCPVRMSPGGVGGGRMLGVTPERVLWPTWQAVVNSH